MKSYSLISTQIHYLALDYTIKPLKWQKTLSLWTSDRTIPG